jgi:hypothetical protein
MAPSPRTLDSCFRRNDGEDAVPGNSFGLSISDDQRDIILDNHSERTRPADF